MWERTSGAQDHNRPASEKALRQKAYLCLLQVGCSFAGFVTGLWGLAGDWTSLTIFFRHLKQIQENADVCCCSFQTV